MRIIPSTLFFFLLWACVDRLQFDIPKSSNYGIVVDGFITDQPSPYTVKISKAFDIESKETIKTPITVKHLILSDDHGFSEELTESNSGIYQTKVAGIRGQIGRVYQLRVELLDGKIYESVPDTLLSAGKMDSVYYSFAPVANGNGSIEYGFDIFANSSQGNSSSSRFLLNMTGTYKADTNPESTKGGCFYLDGKCNYLPACTGLRNVNATSAGLPVYERIEPCSCCTCWYNIFNSSPVLKDDQFTTSDNFRGLKINRIPLNGWIFMHKIRVEGQLFSLTDRTFRFWRAVKDQREATGSLFQPVSGKIPINFIQLSGAKSPVQGLFYAAAVSSKSIYIRRSDIPNESMIPAISGGNISCLELFPNSTAVKPAFWED